MLLAMNLYKPFRPRGELIVTEFDLQNSESVHDGRYFQPEAVEEAEARRIKMLGAVEADAVSELTITDYQKWGEIDWLRRHGTFKTLEKLEKGMRGEYAELIEEMDRVRRTVISEKRLRELTSHDKKAAMSELGDVLWFVNAGASNCGTNLERGFSKYMGTQNNQFKLDEITIGDVEGVIRNGFLPHVMNINALEPSILAETEVSDVNVAMDLLYSSHNTFFGARKVFGYGDEIIGNYGVTKYQHEEVGPAAGHTLVLAAFYAHHHLDSSLSEAIKMNVHKLTLRSKEGNLDKETGGVRSQEEL